VRRFGKEFAWLSRTRDFKPCEGGTRSRYIAMLTMHGVARKTSFNRGSMHLSGFLSLRASTQIHAAKRRTLVRNCPKGRRMAPSGQAGLSRIALARVWSNIWGCCGQYPLGADEYDWHARYTLSERYCTSFGCMKARRSSTALSAVCPQKRRFLIFYNTHSGPRRREAFL
jgi:hypothetical protein